MKKNFFIIIIALIVSSCSTSRVAYFSDLEKPEGNIGNIDCEIKIEPNDKLQITVTSEFPETTMVYNLPISPDHPIQRDMLQQTYIVDKEGYINFPIFGKIFVQGKTTFAIQKELTEKISENVKNPVVRVELVNFKIKVIGEVKDARVFTAERERISILDALAYAGDMTIYGNRENVLLIREENGVKNYYRIDLTKSDILESPYFYLKQNDVIYVEPGKGKASQADFDQNNTYKVSIVSSIISGISVITSLVIALTR